MTTTTTDRVEQLLADRFGDRVYDVHDGTVWVSGMNANCRGVARRIIRDLESHGIACGIVRDDDRNGGVEFAFAGTQTPSHHAVGEPKKRLVIDSDAPTDLDEFREYIDEERARGGFGSNDPNPDPPADDGLAALLALAVAVILAFASGFAVGWFL